MPKKLPFQMHFKSRKTFIFFYVYGVHQWLDLHGIFVLRNSVQYVYLSIAVW